MMLEERLEKLKESIDNMLEVMHDFQFWWADYYNYSMNDTVKVHSDVASGQLEHLEFLLNVIKLNIIALLGELNVEVKWDGGGKEAKTTEPKTEPETPKPTKPTKEDLEPGIKSSKKPKRGRKPKYLGKLIDEYKDIEKHPWIDLTPTIFYRVKNGLLQIAYRTKSGKFSIYGTYEYDKVKDVYEFLPERSTKADVIEACRKAGLKIHHSVITYLMRVFSRYVDFDAEITKEGQKLVLVKNQPHSLAEENRNKLKIEAETIGKPWKVEG